MVLGKNDKSVSKPIYPAQKKLYIIIFFVHT